MRRPRGKTRRDGSPRSARCDRSLHAHPITRGDSRIQRRFRLRLPGGDASSGISRGNRSDVPGRRRVRGLSGSRSFRSRIRCAALHRRPHRSGRKDPALFGRRRRLSGSGAALSGSISTQRRLDTRRIPRPRHKTGADRHTTVRARSADGQARPRDSALRATKGRSNWERAARRAAALAVESARLRVEIATDGADTGVGRERTNRFSSHGRRRSHPVDLSTIHDFSSRSPERADADQPGPGGRG